MKTQVIALALAVGIASSFALADNPSDAPLVTQDATTTAVQQDKHMDQERRKSKEKDESQPQKAQGNESSKNSGKGEMNDRHCPAPTEATPTP